MDAELQSQPSTTCSLHAQLSNSLTSFECSNDIASKQDACVLFTMQLIYGTLHAIPLEQIWPTMRLCIYYHQISSMHETVFEHLNEDPEQKQHCAELYDDSCNKWTRHAKAVLGSMTEALSKLGAMEFDNRLYSTTIPALLKDERQKEHIRLAIEYISMKLIDLTATETTNEKTEKLLSTQRKLVEKQAGEQTAMVWEIVDNEIPHRCPKTMIRQLLTKQVETLQQQLLSFKTTQKN